MKYSKYKAKRFEVDGIIFDSKVEGKYYLHLKEKEKIGLIKSFILQPVYELQPKYRKNDTGIQAIKLKADFQIILADGSELIVDVKGHPTEGAKLKRKMFDYKYPDRKLVWISYSKIDGGWIEYEDLKKARKLRKKAKGEKCHSTKNNSKNF